jgi:3-phenylpropionate/cinnamic acid dioxygenase small subunit
VADISAADLLRAVTEFYFDYADVLDRRQTAAWIEFFGDEAIYSLTTYRNATTKGMYLIFEKGRAAVTRRAALASGYLRAQRNKTLHMISNIRVIEVDDSRLGARAYFAMFRTARDKTSQLHACGEYHDRLEYVDGRLRLVEHNVILDAETLPSNMADLF